MFTLWIREEGILSRERRETRRFRAHQSVGEESFLVEDHPIEVGIGDGTMIRTTESGREDTAEDIVVGEQGMRAIGMGGILELEDDGVEYLEHVRYDGMP